MAVSSHTSTASKVKTLLEKGGERIWRVSDFHGLPFLPVTQTLSRLVKQGIIKRLSKGIYYKSHSTPFGESLPSLEGVEVLQAKTPIYYAGIMAAHFLGFTTQIPKNPVISTSSSSLPRTLLNQETQIHTRRPFSWRSLSLKESALLEFLRKGGRDSELSWEETLFKITTLLKEESCYEKLVGVAEFEPPRIRALLGALGEEIGASPDLLNRLRSSLNSLSRFDFGIFHRLPKALSWQANKGN